MENTSRHTKRSVLDIWEKTGITEHLGGIYATRELIHLCSIKPGQRALDIGCGTGYTACLLAKRYGVNAVALDLNRKLLTMARERAGRESVGDRIALVQADAQNLPFKENVFDAAVAESVLVLCDQVKAASEARRVLKLGGVFGDNELTYLKPPTKELRAVLSEATLGVVVRLLSEDGWREVLRSGGFEDVTSIVHRFSLWQQFVSHLRIDGLRRFFRSWVVVLTDPSLISPFLSRDVLKAILQMWSYVGYGLYVGRKVARK